MAQPCRPTSLVTLDAHEGNMVQLQSKESQAYEFHTTEKEETVLLVTI